MLVKLEKTFPIEAPASAAWALLQDLKSVAECMPGAQITERVDETHYRGQVTVKIGPASAAFKGTIEVQRADPASRRIEIRGKGVDSSGGSAATMDLAAHIRDAGGGRSELVGTSDVTITGRLVSFGGRMLTPVSDQLLNQFGANFANRVVAMAGGAAAERAAARVAGQPRELNLLGLCWRMIVDFVRSLLGSRKPGPQG